MANHKEDKRTIKLTVRLTEDEYQELQKKAIGRTAVWLRELALDQANKKPVSYAVADPELLRHLARIGNNLNQIAHRMNTSGDRVEYIGMMAQLANIAQELELLRSHYVS